MIYRKARDKQLMAEARSFSEQQKAARDRRHAVRLANGTQAKARPTCTCSAYPWPHRRAGGFCRWPGQPVETWQGRQIEALACPLHARCAPQADGVVRAPQGLAPHYTSGPDPKVAAACLRGLVEKTRLLVPPGPARDADHGGDEPARGAPGAGSEGAVVGALSVRKSINGKQRKTKENNLHDPTPEARNSEIVI